ncbi:Uu.00g023600.m01.CDS01 [Anthostomella pinea]|uniref:Uu.00g023600.m01.CDS01 n=1 Tax=Anthostomella pinea TaxID=933095 RepID=A0AAI8YR49_9PEZI|nr:Uu.00g023600.m01.CDS01 [Anthostomella pinea]
MAKEKVVNLLFLSQGVASLDRSETTEHVHLLAALNYYSRIRFITNLLPLIRGSRTLRRVVSVGGGGHEGPIDASDLPALRVPLPELRGHLTTLVTLGLEAVAASAPEVSFVHDYPGTVRTRITSHLPEEVLKTLVFVPIDEVGDRHLYLATSARYPSATGEGDAVPLGEQVGVALGTDGVAGGGLYSVASDCEGTAQGVRDLLAGLKDRRLVDVVWAHTETEFKRITGD